MPIKLFSHVLPAHNSKRKRVVNSEKSNIIARTFPTSHGDVLPPLAHIFEHISGMLHHQLYRAISVRVFQLLVRRKHLLTPSPPIMISAYISSVPASAKVRLNKGLSPLSQIGIKVLNSGHGTLDSIRPTGSWYIRPCVHVR